MENKSNVHFICTPGHNNAAQIIFETYSYIMQLTQFRAVFVQIHVQKQKICRYQDLN